MAYTITILLSFILGWSIITPFLAERSSKGLLKEGLEKAISYSNKTEYHYLLARTFESDLTHSDLKKASAHYIDALRSNPLSSDSWIGLARVYEVLGLETEAERALSAAILVNPSDPRLRWEAAIFYLLRERVMDGFKNLREYLLIKPERQEMVYGLCEGLKISKEYILEYLIPPYYSYYKSYLTYLISLNKLDDARKVWKTLSKRQERIEKDLYLRFIDFLISMSEYNEAFKEWNSLLKDLQLSGNDYGIVVNGGFERDLIGGGFDWKLGKAEGVRISIDDDIHREGSRSLFLSFNGKHNPDLVASSQVVLMKPETVYTLRGYIKTEGLTTTNGIFIEIMGHECKDLYKATDTITATNFWTEVRAEFKTPPDCYAGLVRIRRAHSKKFDNKIGGSAWVDLITIEEGRGY